MASFPAKGNSKSKGGLGGDQLLGTWWPVMQGFGTIRSRFFFALLQLFSVR